MTSGAARAVEDTQASTRDGRLEFGPDNTDFN